MRICLIGKFPPIQGGVSMRTYWTAHALARRGHDVHVVTNAAEVHAPFRMLMRDQDWARCSGTYETGSVAVHWTDVVDRSQTYIPMASPFVSKLVSLAANAHAEQPFDIIHSFYMEPYGIAGHLVAEITNRRHVVRMAGSDAGRLWHHPQFTALYDHVLRSAERVLAMGEVAQRAVARGVDPARVMSGGGFAVPADLFAPAGPLLDLASVRREAEAEPALRELVWGKFAGEHPHFGVYGKLGDAKGSFALLEAMARLRQDGVDVGLVAIAHGMPPIERRFRERAAELGLIDRILQLPFLPHWRVPEFLRGCRAVCCLEQGFPIVFHAPIIAREVLLVGACLVGSAEILRKIPGYERLPSGYGCVAIADVNDVADLARRLTAIIRDPGPLAEIGARGRALARDIQDGIRFPEPLEAVLELAAQRREPAATATKYDTRARDAEGGTASRAAAHAEAVRIDRALQSIADEASQSDAPTECDPLFRLKLARWALAAKDLARLVPDRAPNLRLVSSDFDLREILDARRTEELPAALAPRQSFVAVLAGARRRNPLILDEITAQLLHLCDGVRTVGEIIACLEDGSDAAFDTHLTWIEALFANGLIELREPSG